MKKNISALCFLILMVAVVQADVVVLKNGKKMTIAGAYEVQGQNLVFKHPNGDIVKLPLSVVDMEKSKQATEEHNKMLAAKAAEPPPAPAKKADSMEGIVDQVAKENKKRENGVYLSNGGLDSYSQAHVRVLNDAVESSAGDAAAGETTDAAADPESEVATAGQPKRTSKATPVVLEDSPDVDDDAAARLADPEARKGNADNLQKAHAEASKDAERLDASIAELEQLKDALAVAQNENEDSSSDSDNAKRTEKILAEAKAARAERTKELDAIEKNARQDRVKIKSQRPAEPKAKSDDSAGDGYDSKGKTKPRDNAADRIKRKEDEDDYQVDDNADDDADAEEKEEEDGVDR